MQTEKAFMNFCKEVLKEQKCKKKFSENSGKNCLRGCEKYVIIEPRGIVKKLLYSLFLPNERTTIKTSQEEANRPEGGKKA